MLQYLSNNLSMRVFGVISKQDFLGCSAVMWTAFAGYRDSMVILIHFGANWGASDVYGQTALHAAVSGAQTQCVQYLLWLGADQDDQDR